MADIVCYGACKGDPRYRQEGGVLPCVLCGGSGKLPGPKTAASVMADYVKLTQKLRLSHSAIVAGDVDAGPARVPRRAPAQRRPRIGKRRRRALAREAQRIRDRQEVDAWRAAPHEPWPDDRETIKQEVRAIEGSKRR